MAKTQTLERLIAAATRLKVLREEIAQIEREFPSLAGLDAGTVASRRGRPQMSNATTAPVTSQRKRKRRKMSAAARKAIGDAQRRRWAKQKADAKKAS